MASFGKRPLPFEYLGSEKFGKRRCLFATERCENRETDDQRELIRIALIDALSFKFFNHEFLRGYRQLAEGISLCQISICALCVICG